MPLSTMQVAAEAWMPMLRTVTKAAADFNPEFNIFKIFMAY